MSSSEPSPPFGADHIRRAKQELAQARGSIANALAAMLAFPGDWTADSPAAAFGVALSKSWNGLSYLVRTQVREVNAALELLEGARLGEERDGGPLTMALTLAIQSLNEAAEGLSAACRAEGLPNDMVLPGEHAVLAVTQLRSTCAALEEAKAAL